jgi:hypothetical protein
MLHDAIWNIDGVVDVTEELQAVEAAIQCLKHRGKVLRG